MVASRHIKRGKGSLAVDVCRSKNSRLKLPEVALTSVANQQYSVGIKYVLLHP